MQWWKNNIYLWTYLGGCRQLFLKKIIKNSFICHHDVKSIKQSLIVRSGCWNHHVMDTSSETMTAAEQIALWQWAVSIRIMR